MKIPIVIIVSRIEKDLFIFKQNPKEQSSATIFSKVVSLCHWFTHFVHFSCNQNNFALHTACRSHIIAHVRKIIGWLNSVNFFCYNDYLFYVFTETKEDIVKSYIIISSFPGKIK